MNLCCPTEGSSVNGEGPVPTMDLLRYLGFQPNSMVISDTVPGLSFDFGNLQLSASCVWSPGVGISGGSEAARGYQDICNLQTVGTLSPGRQSQHPLRHRSILDYASVSPTETVGTQHCHS